MKYPYGKEILIVGASSGIGKEAVTLFAEAGFTVWAVSRSMEPQTTGTVHTCPMDVTDDGSVSAAMAWIRENGGDPGILLYCVGIGIAGSVEDTPIEAVRRQMEPNYYGFLRLLPHVMPSMREKKNGLVLAVSSVAGLVSLPFQSQYSAGKYALEATVQALRNEVKPYGEKAVAHMAKDEQNGKSPVTAAGVALKLAGMKNPPQHNVVGWDYKLLALGIKLLPAALVEKVMGMLYCK